MHLCVMMHLRKSLKRTVIKYFGLVGAAWDLTKENFMANVKQINFLKLKASIGVLGNQSASNHDGVQIAYPFYPTLNAGQAAVFGTSSYNAADVKWEPNPDLKMGNYPCTGSWCRSECI
jgi:hypothetical protein